MKNIHERLQIATEKLKNKTLFDSKGLGNEINFHVFDYDPQDEYIIRDYLENDLLKKKNLNIKVFDIYNIIIDVLEEKGFLKKCFDYEKKKGTEYINDIISKTIKIGSKDDLIVKKIKEGLEPNCIVLITGLGKCYGIVRGHTILNSLHSVVTSNPVLMFYPGQYNQQSFSLFNKLENDNYYRAFPFVERK